MIWVLKGAVQTDLLSVQHSDNRPKRAIGILHWAAAALTNAGWIQHSAVFFCSFFHTLVWSCTQETQ